MWANFGDTFRTSCLGFVVAALVVASPLSAASELICHTDDPRDCYPKIFLPTKDFQIIKDDQDLPPGLHVRMNIFTGEKEARPNIPIEGKDQLDDVTEQAVIMIPQPDSDDAEVVEQGQMPPGAPSYEPVGKIQQPHGTTESSTDTENFDWSLAVLSNHPNANDMVHLESALSILNELAHDIYYGLELAKRGDVIKRLIDFVSGEEFDGHGMADRSLRHQAALIIGHAIQNNPTALRELLRFWDSEFPPSCPSIREITSAEPSCEQIAVGVKMRNLISSETSPEVLKAQIYTLNGLSKDKGVRDAFVADGGMEVLLSKFSPCASSSEQITIVDSDEQKHLQVLPAKIAQFVMDTFLDEDMGAEIGIWPQSNTILSQKECGLDGTQYAEGCWELAIDKNLNQSQMGEKEKEIMNKFLSLLKIRREIAQRTERGEREL